MIFFKFVKGSRCFLLKKTYFSGKCEHKLAYNVIGLVLNFVSSHKSKAEYILTTMNKELLAARPLIIQSGALLVSVNIKLA